jgi:hypothetical protein
MRDDAINVDNDLPMKLKTFLRHNRIFAAVAKSGRVDG